MNILPCLTVLGQTEALLIQTIVARVFRLGCRRFVLNDTDDPRLECTVLEHLLALRRVIEELVFAG